MTNKVICIEAQCKNCGYDFMVKKAKIVPRYLNIRVCLYASKTPHDIFGQIVRKLKKALCNNTKNRQNISEFIQTCKQSWDDLDKLAVIYNQWVEIEWVV